MKRVFLVVVDSLGIGELPDAKEWGDLGSNTFGALVNSGKLNIPTLINLGIGNIDGVNYIKAKAPYGSYCRLCEVSNGKDTTVGHFEMMGIITRKPYPTFPNGFPQTIVDKLEKSFKKQILCNEPYSGTEVIKDFGQEHIITGCPIVYTSADSVLQIATHEDIYSIKELYKLCKQARKIMTGKWGVNRVIARPFSGEYPNFFRTDLRKDFALAPKENTALDILKTNGKDVISVGKINDVFAGRGITKILEAHNNQEVEKQLLYAQSLDFEGLCFVNFNDFDSKYGHRNNVDGYAEALNKFDITIKNFIEKMKKDDILIITSDHGNDPSTLSTDHSREYTFCLVYGDEVKSNINLKTRVGLCDISATILELFNLRQKNGESFWNYIKK